MEIYYRRILFLLKTCFNKRRRIKIQRGDKNHVIRIRKPDKGLEASEQLNFNINDAFWFNKCYKRNKTNYHAE